jgi:hypothetical protein
MSVLDSDIYSQDIHIYTIYMLRRIFGPKRDGVTGRVEKAA